MLNTSSLLTISDPVDFMTEGLGGMLVIVFVMLPYLLYYYNLKSKNLMSRGLKMEFWSTKGSGMLLGSIGIGIYELVSTFIVKLPPVFIGIFGGLVFLPLLRKEIKISKLEEYYRTHGDTILKEIPAFPEPKELEFGAIYSILGNLAVKHPRFKKVSIVISIPIILIKALKSFSQTRKEEKAFYNEALKGRPVHRWNSNKLKKEKDKIRLRSEKASREAERERQILERQKAK